MTPVFDDVADVDAEDPVDDSLVEVLKLKFARDFEPEYLSRYWSYSFVKVLKQISRQDLEAQFWSRFWNWSFVEILRLNCQDFEAEFDQDFEVEIW